MELSPFLQRLLPGEPTHLRWPWVALFVAALLLGLVLWWLLRPATVGASFPVSDTARLRALARFRTLVRRRRGLAAVQVFGAVLGTAGCLLLVARPSDVETSVDRPSRDVVICLDVSPSMLKVDAMVARAVQDVVASLPGDRFGLTVFDGRTVVKFPLTQDRSFVDRALHQAETAFEERDTGYYRATRDPYRASILSDGLQACVNGFDRLTEQRGRVVLAVSDARPYGSAVYELGEVGEQARARHVILQALAPVQTRPARADQFREVAELTGGELALLEEDAVDEVVARIDSVEQRRLAGPPRTLVDDRPHGGLLLTAVGVAVLGGTWLRRRP